MNVWLSVIEIKQSFKKIFGLFGVQKTNFTEAECLFLLILKRKTSRLITLSRLMMSGLLSSGLGGKSSKQPCSFLHYPASAWFYLCSSPKTIWKQKNKLCVSLRAHDSQWHMVSIMVTPSNHAPIWSKLKICLQSFSRGCSDLDREKETWMKREDRGSGTLG